MTVCIDFETTASSNEDCADPENKKMIAVSFVIIFAFHPDSEIDLIIIERSFGHSQSQLFSLNYLTTEQLKYKNLTLLKQIKDCALSVLSKKRKIAISEMFTTELKLASDCLIKWFNAKYKSQNIVISNDLRRKYEIEHPTDYSKNRCCICTFPIEINPTMYDASKDQMFYADFIIFKEHKFLRNIFSEKELSATDALKNLEIYHQKFTKFLQVLIYLQNSINMIKDFDYCPHEELQDFISEFCQDCVDFAEINEKIIEVEMKNTYRTKITKIPYKFMLLFIRESWTSHKINLTKKNRHNQRFICLRP